MYDRRHVHTCSSVTIPRDTTLTWLVGRGGDEVELSIGAGDNAILDIEFEMIDPIISALTSARNQAARARGEDEGPE
ncbi:hypothetical protein [Halostreptopolyspora alba]|uniref:Uncharacterized protein n=1 Tax=Halostreptopolyspora alba TaxID=2487137 RepID=A0A3N0E709_9ACTN|nr:hypothetical protein EFW17_15460 [Nocardiopsaceae bacterium YIM 96095]